MKRVVRWAVMALVCGAAVGGLAHAETGKVKTQFKGWIGKKQQGYIMDASGWHYCWSSSGGTCGSKSLTTGSSSCITNGFDIGAAWNPPKVSGLNVSAGYSKSWSACNTRSETISCEPNKGYRGRAVVNFSKRWGKIHVVGGDNYPSPESSCPAGWRADWQGGSRWRCTYVGGSYDRDGYLPEWRGSSCQYQKI